MGNYKNEDGLTPLHQAVMSASPEFVKKLLDEKADPNVPATKQCLTPSDLVLDKLSYETKRDEALCNWDELNKLDDTCTAYKSDLSGYKEIAKLLKEAGGVRSLAYSPSPNIKPDGSVNGGDPN